MALLTLTNRDRELEYDAVDLLPGLEDDVFFEDDMLVELVVCYTDGLEDWWGGFISDMNL